MFIKHIFRLYNGMYISQGSREAEPTECVYITGRERD